MDSRNVFLSRPALVSIAATFLVMGLIVSSYGPLLVDLTERFGISLPVAGATISIHYAGGLVGVIVAMRTMQRLPARATVMVATGLAAAGCAGAAFAPSWPAFVVAIAVVGVGFGALVIALNQAVTYSQGRRRGALLNGLNGLYSAGAVAGPILVAALGRHHFSVLFGGIAVLAACLVPAAAGITGTLPVPQGAPARPGRLVLIFVVAIVLYVAIENGAGGWMTSHLVSTGVTFPVAAAFTSGFWLALVAGRLLITLAPARLAEARVVIAAAVLATVGLLAANAGGLAPWAYVVTGFAIAPIYPTAIVWLARLRPGDARATAWLFPATSVGGIAGPAAIGLVIANFGVRWTPAVLAAVAIAMTVAFWSATRVTEAR